jgi:uncharacterized protein
MEPITPQFIQKKIAEGQPYTMVLLKQGPRRDNSEVNSGGDHTGHLAHLFKLIQEGKMLICGPIMNHPELRGMAIYASADKVEVRKFVEADPAVRDGHFAYEFVDWFGIPGFGMVSSTSEVARPLN